MEIKILSEKENPLLERKEIRFEILFAGGIKSVRMIRKEIISTLKSKEELTILNGLKTKFGEKRAEGYVKVYKNKEALKVEPNFRLEKNFKKEEKAVTEKETKEEKKSDKEETKEAPKAEKSVKPETPVKKEKSKKKEEVKNG